MPGKILILHSSSDLYGAGRIVLDSIRALKQEGYQIVVMLPYDGPLCGELEKLEVGVVVRNLGILRKKYLNVGGLFQRLYKIASVIGKIRALIREHRIDLVYSNTSTVLAGAIAARLEAVPHLYHIHEIPTAPRWFVSFIGRFINLTSNKVIVVSNAVRNHWIKWVNGSKMIRIYNGISTERESEGASEKQNIREELGISPEEQVICAIGRILPLKGHSYLMDIAEEMLQKSQRSRFLIIGDPFSGYEDLYNTLVKRCSKGILKGKVHMLGFRNDITNILNGADLLVHPSVLPDSLPTVILEAMHAGLPVAATNMGGASELVVNGKTGIIIPHDDSKNAAAMIAQLISQKEKMDQMGIAGKQRIGLHFTIEVYSKQLVSAIDELVVAKQ